MSFQTRLSTLISAIGADIKALQNATKPLYNASLANQTGFENASYLAGSGIAIPQGKIKAGTIYRCKFNVVKTAAGAAAPVVAIRVGTTGTITDTSRAAATFAVQTAAADEGEFEIECVFRSAGATAVIQTIAKLWHRMSTGGLNTVSHNTFILNTGAAFDVTGAGLQIGVSVHNSASTSWTVSIVRSELVNLAA